MWESHPRRRNHPKPLDASNPEVFHLAGNSTGELALEAPVGAGSAVDAEVPPFRVVHQLLPHALGAGRLEEALHRDGEGAAHHQAQGTPQLPHFPNSALIHNSELHMRR